MTDGVIYLRFLHRLLISINQFFKRVKNYLVILLLMNLERKFLPRSQNRKRPNSLSKIARVKGLSESAKGECNFLIKSTFVLKLILCVVYKTKLTELPLFSIKDQIDQIALI